VGQESSSSGDATSSEESGSEEAEEAGDDGATESSGEASSRSSQGTGDDEDSDEVAPYMLEGCDTTKVISATKSSPYSPVSLPERLACTTRNVLTSDLFIMTLQKSVIK
jgi:hypothetical protein